MHLILAVLTLFHHAPKPKWEAGIPVCRAGYSVWVDEGRAIKGKHDVTLCVRD
jgi:hypothetical protein